MIIRTRMTHFNILRCIANNHQWWRNENQLDEAKQGQTIMYELMTDALMFLVVYSLVVLPVSIKYIKQIRKERTKNVTQDHFDNFVGKI